jgi:hypothetical protein
MVRGLVGSQSAKSCSVPAIKQVSVGRRPEVVLGICTELQARGPKLITRYMSTTTISHAHQAIAASDHAPAPGVDCQARPH